MHPPTPALPAPAPPTPALPAPALPTPAPGTPALPARPALRALLVLALGGLGAGAAGCTVATQNSAGRFQGESRAAAQTVDDLSSAASRKDPGKVCNDLLAGSLVARLNTARGGCQQAVRDQLDDADTFDVKVESVSVQGTRASARVKSRRSGHDSFDTLTLVKERGRWRISALA